MALKDDPDYARGLRAPGPIPGRAVWQNIQAVRKSALALEKLLRALFRGFEGDQVATLLANLDMVVSYAEALLARYDRNGPPVDQSLLNDMDATLRLAEKYPEHFPGVDLVGLKKEADMLRKKGGAP